MRRDRVRRHISMTPTCVWGCNTDETTLHVLRDCIESMRLWLSLIRPSSVHRFFNCTLWDWCRMNLNANVRREEKSWKELFVALCWLLWRCQNEKIFADVTMSASEVLMRAKATIHSFSAAKISLKKVNLRGINREDAHLLMSSNGFTVVHVDRGKAVEAFLFRLEEGDTVVAKLWACLLGLERARDGGHCKVCVKSDCLEAVHLIREGDVKFREH